MTAGKSDLHRESSGVIVRDDLVIAHSSNMARPNVIPKLNEQVDTQAGSD